MLKLFDEFVLSNYSVIVGEGIELDNVEYQEFTSKIQVLANMVKAELPESAHRIFMQYSDSITDRTIVSNGLYYKRGFSDGIKFILQIAMKVGGD